MGGRGRPRCWARLSVEIRCRASPGIGALAPTINLWFSAGFSPGDDALECLSVSSEAGAPKAPEPSSPGEGTLGSYRLACGENPGFVECRFVIACVRPEYAQRGSDSAVSSFTPLPRRLPREQAEALFLPYLGSNPWIVLRRDFSSRIIFNWRIGDRKSVV